MPKYRRKALILEAEQFLAGKLDIGVLKSAFGFYYLPTPEGNYRIEEGDWVVTGIDGKRYVVNGEMFQRLYEKFEEGVPHYDDTRDREINGDSVLPWSNELYIKIPRLEDLGVIREKLEVLLDSVEFLNRASSKHSIEPFIEFYSNTQRLEQLHDEIRYLHDILWEIFAVAKGNNRYE